MPDTTKPGSGQRQSEHSSIRLKWLPHLHMILIVDDRPENILSLRRTLELEGFVVESATSGEEALRKVLKQDFSLIILDVQMPGMDGFEVAEALQGYSKAADIPIIFLSAVSTEKRFITKGYKSGAVDYVVKPVDPDIFILKVKTLHRLHEQSRELTAMHRVLLDEVAIRRSAEAALNLRVDELRSILHSIPQIAFTLTPDGQLDFFNDHWLQQIGEEQQMATPHPDDAHVRQALNDAVQRGVAYQAELRIFLRSFGVYRWHLLRIVPVAQGEKILKWVGTFTDIHERKAASDVLEEAVTARTTELLKKNKELESSNYDLQQFGSVASHDLKEPLRKIQVFGSILQKRLRDAVPAEADSMARIMNIADRMGTLINDLLSYSRLSASTHFEPVSLEEVVGEIASDFEYAVAAKNGKIEADPLPVIDAVPAQMRQVFQNLISNALKFSRPGVPPVVHITCAYNESTCSITIADNGIGFDEAYLEKIFTIFQRLNTTDAYEGTGIGLAIVKKIVDRHGGNITARSREGSGAAFIITLPMHHTTEETLLNHEDTALLS